MLIVYLLQRKEKLVLLFIQADTISFLSFIVFGLYFLHTLANDLLGPDVCEQIVNN
jgi:hypothetical protein